MNEGTTRRLPRIGSLPRIGDVLGDRYMLSDDVGSGPLAHVYAAWDQQLSHRVAVKMLDARFLHRPQVVEAFVGESQRIANLPSHRNIATVHEVEREGQFPYVVMEYVPGESLQPRLAPRAPLSAEDAFHICQQVAKGLDFAHEYGIVHGNLKPENILLTRNGHAKVTDFGLGTALDIAREFGALPPVARARYMSPEQAAGYAPTPRSDVFSLGVILYEMLTGRLPSRPEDVSAILSEYTRGHRGRAGQMGHVLPLTAQRIVVRALMRDPEQRYPTAGAFASALHHYLLLDAGSTILDLPGALQEQRLFTDVVEESETQEAARVQAPTAPATGAHSLRRVAGSLLPRRLTVTDLVFVAVLLVALIGGWLAYRAVSNLIEHWGQPPGANVGRPVRTQALAHVASSRLPSTAVAGPTQLLITGTAPGVGCGQLVTYRTGDLPHSVDGTAKKGGSSGTTTWSGGTAGVTCTDHGQSNTTSAALLVG